MISARTLLLVLLTALLVQAAHQPAAFAQDDIEGVWDPAEPVNRGIFWFNDQVDTYALEPVARGYDKIVPDPVQDSINNVFTNLRWPRYLVSDLVQFKFKQAATHTGRFLINSTLGVLGIFDVASSMGLEDREEDFGLALAYRGVPPGPYIVIPLIGPSNVRDGIGRIVDTFLDPFVLLTYKDISHVRAGISDPIAYSAYGLKIVQQRADLIDAINAAKESSLDYYLFTQGAYYQYRRGLLYGGNPPALEGAEGTEATDEGTAGDEFGASPAENK